MFGCRPSLRLPWHSNGVPLVKVEDDMTVPCPLRVVAALEESVESNLLASFVNQSATVKAKGNFCEPEGEETIQALQILAMTVK